MRRIFYIFIIVLMGLASLTGRAAAQASVPVTALQLQNLCVSTYDVDIGICAGYVMAVAERLLAESNPHTQVCLSPSIAPMTLVENIQREWAATPPLPHEFASESVDAALRRRFRCP